MSYPNNILARETANGITIEIEGWGALSAMFQVLMRAKFGAELDYDILTSPFLNEILISLAKKGGELKSGNSNAFLGSVIDRELLERIREEIGVNVDRGENGSAEILDILAKAVSPYKIP